MIFKPLDLADQATYLQYLGEYKFHTYEFSFLNLYLWRKFCQTEYTIVEDSLVIKKKDERMGNAFMQPLGYKAERLESIIEKLVGLQKEGVVKYLFREVEEPFLQQLQAKYGNRLIICHDEGIYDYIYESKKLIELNGDKLRKRKAHANRFVDNYSYVLKDMSESGVVEDCLNFAQRWYDSQDSKPAILSYEIEGIKDVMSHLDTLKGVGMAVYVGGSVVGFTIGEKLNSQMAVIHIEKGDVAYKGIYAFINRTFAEKYFSNVPYINREEDMGLEGLKKAKKAYEPVRLERKFVLDLK